MCVGHLHKGQPVDPPAPRCKDAKDAGFTCKDAKEAGFTCKDAKEAGFKPMECMQAGYSIINAPVNYGSFRGCTVVAVHADGSVDINVPGVGIRRALSSEWNYS